MKHELRQFLRRPRPPPLPFPKPSRSARLKSDREIREAEILARGELRHDVLIRAEGKCENLGCRRPLATHGFVFDHWLGGNGRRRQAESLATCWALCTACNEARTANEPSAAVWNDLFRRHCRLHGYKFTPHITKFQALAAAGSRR